MALEPSQGSALRGPGGLPSNPLNPLEKIHSFEGPEGEMEGPLPKADV